MGESDNNNNYNNNNDGGGETLTAKTPRNNTTHCLNFPCPCCSANGPEPGAFLRKSSNRSGFSCPWQIVCRIPLSPWGQDLKVYNKQVLAAWALVFVALLLC